MDAALLEATCATICTFDLVDTCRKRAIPRMQSDWWQGGEFFLASLTGISCSPHLLHVSLEPADACSRALSARVATFTTRSLGEGDSLAEEVRHKLLQQGHGCAPAGACVWDSSSSCRYTPPLHFPSNLAG